MTRSAHMLRRGIAVLVALTWATSAHPATQFVTQTVRSAGVVGQFASFALGPQGQPTIGFWDENRQDIELATKLNGAWSVETAESTTALGLHTSLAVSSGGEPRISYYDATNTNLKFASRTGAAWSVENVDTLGDVGLYTSLKLDAADNPHISYYDVTHGDLKYAAKAGGVWTVETVDAAGDVGAYTSLALDAGGNPSISYWDATNGDLKLARKSGGVWAIETVDATGVVGEFSSLVLDATGNPRVSYFDRTRGRLKYGSQSGGVWTLQTVPDSLSAVGEYSSLALNSIGDPRISYFDVTNADLRFAKLFRQTSPRDTTFWIVGSVDAAGDVGRFTSLAVDAFDDPQIAYWDASNKNLKYARNTGGSWTVVQIVESIGDVGQYASLALAGGVTRISYWDTSRQDLKLATLNSGIWSIEVADDGGNVGQYASLALDAQGDPFLSYYDNTYGAGNLRAASRIGGVWSSALVDSAGDVGRFTSIAVDALGEPRISYYDATQGHLKYAFRIGGIWTLETVDMLGNVGQYTSLALTAAGDARISYFDVTQGDLKFASRGAGGGWTVETVDAAGTVGQYTSLALDAQGDPHISYYDATNGDLKYASRSGGTWTIERADSIGDVGQYTSLALARGPSARRPGDAAGDPRIAYFDVTHKDLKFASRSAGGWASETLDELGDVGQFTSLAIDAAANAELAYFDVTNGDLKYAVQHYPDIALWTYPGAFSAGPDSIRSRAKSITLRWMRDPLMELRADFGGYRIYRVFYAPDTARFELIRRFSVNAADSLFMWHFPHIDETTPLTGRLATFVDPDSDGTFFKRCRRDSLGKCYSPGDSIIVLIPPPGPHDGFRTWYAITYEARNISSNDYLDMLVDDAIACPNADRGTCPNLNNKSRNLVGPVEPTIGPTANLQKVAVVPNPFRASEVWDLPGGHEVHFINLPPQARIRIYTVSGDLVADLQHKDTVRDFERWDLKNGRGRDVSSGIYVFRVEAANFFAQDRFVVIR